MRISDWSSDVCSSDLQQKFDQAEQRFREAEEIASGRKKPTPGTAEAPAEGEGEGKPAASPKPGIDVKAMVRAIQFGDEREADRKSVVEGRRVSVRVNLGGRRIIKNKKKQKVTR